MNEKKYIVRLSKREREELTDVVKRLKGLVPEGPPSPDSVEGGRSRPELDGREDRRGVFLPRADGGKPTQASGDRGISGCPGWQAARNSA